MTATTRQNAAFTRSGRHSKKTTKGKLGRYRSALVASRSATYSDGLFTAQLEVLATLEGELLLVLAGSALHSEDDLLGGLGLLLEDGLGLTTETLLLAVVSSLTLGE
jgi:hypothetical protein